MRHIKRNFKAISPVLAVLMMIAIAISGSLVTYAWAMGYIDLTNEKAGQDIKVQSIANHEADLLVYVQNTGEGVVQLEEGGCLYVNGELVDCTISHVAGSEGIATLGEGETAIVTYVNGAVHSGEKVEVKVTTLSGRSSEYSDYPAGTAYAPSVLDHFSFDAITSPQTSGVPFTITIWAVDQCGKHFTGYNGANSLTYSEGIMTPTTTDGFLYGIWSGAVTVTGSATNATISTVSHVNSSWTGTSNSFDVQETGIVYSDYPQYELLGGGARWAARDGQNALYINWYDGWVNHHDTDGVDWIWYMTVDTMKYWKNAVTQTLEEWDFEVTCLGDLPRTLDELDNFDVIVFEGRFAAEPALAPLMEEYIENGGGLVIFGAVPCYFSAYCRDGWPYLVGGPDLTALQHWLGCGYFINTGGVASAVVDYPVGTSLRDGDVILDDDFIYNRAVTDLVSGAEVVAMWDTGYVYSYTYEYGAGRVFYHGCTFPVITSP